ncbi:hypothetical protein CY34DRAFT_126567 [Suillus luteus UH-Slu-Lm8-n1]|uniref:Uncharacterized protein n=1 Tax=Suillus luteus UH-Slu-Lm8-n1 TaxID=930992 RepID=A0A0D0BZ35_9AGAM|nr:hypothetical protein CY34DRAFT_126567 [Suillus luteus UH-Slu-Lm8-n1]
MSAANFPARRRRMTLTHSAGRIGWDIPSIAWHDAAVPTKPHVLETHTTSLLAKLSVASADFLLSRKAQTLGVSWASSRQRRAQIFKPQLPSRKPVNHQSL